MQFGVEIDVAAFQEPGGAGAPAGWTPPPPSASLPLEMSGVVVEVGIFSRSGGPRLVGAVELVSPANKDRPLHREAFVSKCVTYLQAGVGLVLVDVVTERPADLHRELLVRLGMADPGPGPALSGSAFRPVERDGARRWTCGASRSRWANACRLCPSGFAAASACPSSWKAPTSAPASNNGCSPPRERRAAERGRSRPGQPSWFPGVQRFPAGRPGGCVGASANEASVQLQHQAFKVFADDHQFYLWTAT